MSWFNVYNRPVYGGIVAFGAGFGMAINHQPLIWVVITSLGGFVLGYLTAPRKKNA